MWKVNLRHLSSQPESIPSQTSGRRLTLLHRTKTSIPEFVPLQRTMSMPEFEVYSGSAEDSSDDMFSGHMSDSTCLSVKAGRRRLRGETPHEGAGSMGTKIKIRTTCTQKPLPVSHSQSGASSKILSTTDNHKTPAFLRSLRSRRTPQPASKHITPVHSTRETLGVSGFADAEGVFDGLDNVQADQSETKPMLRNPSSRERSSAKVFMNKQNMRPWEASEESSLLKHIQETYTADANIKWDQVALTFGRTSVGCMTKYYTLKSS